MRESMEPCDGCDIRVVSRFMVPDISRVSPVRGRGNSRNTLSLTEVIPDALDVRALSLRVFDESFWVDDTELRSLILVQKLAF